MKILSIAIICFSSLITPAISQKQWYYGLEAGGKISFLSPSRYEAEPVVQVSGAAAQGGIIVGFKLPNQNMYIESGIIVGRHVLNFRRGFPEKNYLGDVFDGVLRFQVMEFPFHIGYDFHSTEQSKLSVFAGARAMGFGYRPYSEPAPWKLRNGPYAQSVYIVPDSPNGERRYFQASSNVAEVSAGANLDIGFGYHYSLSNRWVVGVTLTFSKGLFVLAHDDLNITLASRDEYGVLVPRELFGFGSSSRGTNLELNIGIIYQ